MNISKKSPPYVALPNRLASSIQFFVEKSWLGLNVNLQAPITKTEQIF